MVYQYYVIELQQYQDGTYGNLTHYAYDADPKIALLKGESKYHEVLAAAAISSLPRHGAILVSSKCVPAEYKCYEHGEPDAQELYQYYIAEIQQYPNGEYGHLIHHAEDQNPRKAQLKGESKFYQVLSAAAISEIPQHAAILMTSKCEPLDYKCYEDASLLTQN